MYSLNIIGAGKLGKTLGCLWRQRQIFSIAGICNRSLPSARAAQAFIGSGTPRESIEEMPDADCWLIASGDNDIEQLAEQLGQRLNKRPLQQQSKPIVFHCSGALPASALAPCRSAAIASAHPVHSFADPAQSIVTLPGSTVALEGHTPALTLLRYAFSALECPLIELDASQKVLYHTGSVIACNYLTVLIDLSLQSFAAAGIDRESAKKLLQPIVLQTAQNNFSHDPEGSLTGPIARGDAGTIAKQLQALQGLNSQLENCYRALGLAGVNLAERSGLSVGTAQQLRTIFNEHNQ